MHKVVAQVCKSMGHLRRFLAWNGDFRRRCRTKKHTCAKRGKKGTAGEEAGRRGGRQSGGTAESQGARQAWLPGKSRMAWMAWSGSSVMES